MTRTEFLLMLTANIISWPIIHVTMSWVGTNLPTGFFQPTHLWFHEYSWEKGGRVYDRVFRIRGWKGLLPDAAAWFEGGFAKKHLQGTDPEYLSRFILETCRGEAVHWWTLAAAGIFVLWNPPWAVVIMFLYAVIANLPCILLQRYNRARIRRLLANQSQHPRSHS